jgi:hypothetical protein
LLIKSQLSFGAADRTCDQKIVWYDAMKVAGGSIQVSRYDGATRNAKVGVNLGKRHGVADGGRLGPDGWLPVA